jgi:uncharacterized membrane protein YjgN (DUF898 family)
LTRTRCLETVLIIYGTLVLACWFLIGSVFHALISNLIWSNTRLGEHRIECNMSPFTLMWISLSNFVLVVLTVGLFMPWADGAPGAISAGIRAAAAGERSAGIRGGGA